MNEEKDVDNFFSRDPAPSKKDESLILTMVTFDRTLFVGDVTKSCGTKDSFDKRKIGMGTS